MGDVAEARDINNNSLFWIALAEEAVAQAQLLDDKDQKQILLRIAESYREIGRLCERPKPH